MCLPDCPTVKQNFNKCTFKKPVTFTITPNDRRQKIIKEIISGAVTAAASVGISKLLD